MTLKEIAKRDLEAAIARLEAEPTVQHWLAVDRLALVYVQEVEDEQRLKQRAQPGGMAELADAASLNLAGQHAHVGSTPTVPTISEVS